MAFSKKTTDDYASKPQDCIVIGVKGSKGVAEGKPYDSTKLYILRKLEGEGRVGVTAVEYPFGLEDNFQQIRRAGIQIPAQAKVVFRRTGKSLDRDREKEEVVSVEWVCPVDVDVVGHALAGKKFEPDAGKKSLYQENTLFDVGGDSDESTEVLGVQSGKGEYKGMPYDYTRLHRLLELPESTGIGYVVGLVDFGKSTVFDQLMTTGFVFPASVDLSLSSSARASGAEVELATAMRYNGPLSLKPVRPSPAPAPSPVAEKAKA